MKAPKQNTESIWHPSSEKAQEGRAVWIIERHPTKRHNPQSFSIHGGWVHHSNNDNNWIVMQHDEAGQGSKFWKPEESADCDDNDFCAWSYPEDASILPSFVLD